MVSVVTPTRRNAPNGGNLQTPNNRGVSQGHRDTWAPARVSQGGGQFGENNLSPPVILFPAVFRGTPLGQQFPGTPFGQQSVPLNNQRATWAPLPSGTSQNNGDLPPPRRLFMDN